jgi:sugar phosphate isomerase/epimerase
MMQHPTTRRRFLSHAALSLAGLGLLGAPAAAVEPFKRPGSSRLRLSLAAYSFRQYFVHGGSRQTDAAAKRIDLFDFMDFCADHDCEGAELTSYYFPPEVTTDYLIKLRRHAFLRGLAISGTAVGNNFTLPPGPKLDAQISSVKKWIGYAAIMGAPHIRIFAGGGQGMSKEEASKVCLAAMEECAEEAGKHGIFLGLENHGGIVAQPAEVLDLVKAVKSPWLGINLDTGNFSTDDPYADLALCAPYAVNVQFKAEIRRRGQKAEPADLPRLVKMLRDANYQGYVALEYESAPDPWKAVPDLLQAMKRSFS